MDSPKVNVSVGVMSVQVHQMSHSLSFYPENYYLIFFPPSAHNFTRLKPVNIEYRINQLVVKTHLELVIWTLGIGWAAVYVCCVAIQCQLSHCILLELPLISVEICIWAEG